MITGRCECRAGPRCYSPGRGCRSRVRASGSRRALPELARLVDELVGADCFERAGESTRYAQPAIFLSSLAAFLELEEPERAIAFAGHSLGELSALAAAGVLSFEDAARARRAARAADGRVRARERRRQHARAAARHARGRARVAARGRRVGRQRQRARARSCSPARARGCAAPPRSGASAACERWRSTSPAPFTRRGWPPRRSRSARRSTASSSASRRSRSSPA